MSFEKIRDVATELLRMAVTQLPSDVKQALENASSEEKSEAGRMQLEAILSNIEAAEKGNTPMCQDTGVIIFYVAVGEKFGPVGKVRDALVEATRKATATIPLRPNAVHPLTRKNSGDNTGADMPYVNWDVVDGDFIEITAFPKGAGSENMSNFAMLTPGLGSKDVKKFVIDTVIKAGGQPCPPTIIGVGVGGSADIAMKLAKKALLRPLNIRNQDPDIARLESELLEAVNMTGVGPMGLGGRFTSIGLNIEYAHSHTASLPVGVNLQCWAARRATARIYSNGLVEYVSHRR
jgi:fumarate hydratase subunit alpha